MFLITLWVTGIVFLITNVLLFWFAWKYRNRPGVEAVHFAHSNKLEFIWTIVPTIVLTGLVVFGLQAWTRIMGAPGEGSMTVEMTGQQFFWSCRYTGPDGKLGARDYDLICPENPIGIATVEWIEHRKITIAGSEKLQYKGEIQKLNERAAELTILLDSLNNLINNSPNKYRIPVYKDEAALLQKEFDKIPEKIKIREKCLVRLNNKYTAEYIAAHQEELTWGYDDPMPSELHVPVNQEIFVKITALDVLHNFYIPHMDVKMDAVPGMPTSFKFKPLVTTDDKRVEMSENPEWQNTEEGATEPRWKSFNYEIACAELCGTGHSSMKYILVVEEQAAYDEWMAGQKSKWSQVRADLKLENGFSKFAPGVPAPVVADSITTLQTDTAMISMNLINSK
jgi:cytochrome c oxidase subunit 2